MPSEADDTTKLNAPEIPILQAQPAHQVPGIITILFQQVAESWRFGSMNRLREASLRATPSAGSDIEVHKMMFLRGVLNENGLHLLQKIEQKGRFTNRRFWTFMSQATISQSTVSSHWLSKSW